MLVAAVEAAEELLDLFPAAQGEGSIGTHRGRGPEVRAPLPKRTCSLPNGPRSKCTSGRSNSEASTKTFTDPRLCAAIVDRLTYDGNFLETSTDSYCLAHTRAQHTRA